MAALSAPATGVTTARANQKLRTRKDLLQTAARLIKEGRKPGLEEIAEAALVSRATAYRYFPSAEALLLEASFDVDTPQADRVFRDAPADDPAARLERVDAAFHDMILANEPSLRMMLVHSLQRSLQGGNGDKIPARQNRRTPLIEAALAPSRRQFRPADLRLLSQALALVIGTEAMMVCKDVLQLDDAQSRKVKRWAIRALVEAAKKPVSAK